MRTFANILGAGLLLSLAGPHLLAQMGGFGGFGQMGGSMLNVGQPNQSPDTRVAIRPWATVAGNYASNVEVRPGGQDLTTNGYGALAGYGVGGQKAWYRTTLGVNFAGMYRPKLGLLSRTLSSHTLSLGVSHLLGPRTRVTAGTFASYGNGGFGVGGGGFMGGGMMMPFGSGSFFQQGAADFGSPISNGLVDNEIFDVPTIGMGASAGIVHQLGERWTAGGGGGVFLTRRRYRGLAESQGGSGYAMTSYSINRTTSLGVQYGEQHFSFRNLFGNNRGQNLGIFLNKSITRSLSAGVSAGAFRFSSRFVGRVEVDPALQELLGGFTSYEVREVRRTDAMGNAFLAKTYSWGWLNLNASRFITPGNGILLASRADRIGVNATTNLPGRFALGGIAAFSRLTSLQQSGLRNDLYMVGGNLARAISGGFWASFSAGYRSVEFPNRPGIKSRFLGVGITWTPTDAAIVF